MSNLYPCSIMQDCIEDPISLPASSFCPGCRDAALLSQLAIASFEREEHSFSKAAEAINAKVETMRLGPACIFGAF
jgi:hypothetical protein